MDNSLRFWRGRGEFRSRLNGEGKSETASAHSARRRTDFLANGVERAVGVLAERRDGCQADHDDQGQHDRVLDGRRAIFAFTEIDDEILHTSQHEKTSSG